MKNYQDLEIPLDMTIPHIRRFTKIVYPGVKLFTDEQVQHLTEIRKEMQAGLSWKELEARYAAPKNEPKEQPKPDSDIQQANQENLSKLKKKIHRVGERVIAPLVVKDATDSVRNLPYMFVAAHLYLLERGDELVEESFDVMGKAINEEPNGIYTGAYEMIAELVDSAYEQGRRITGTTSTSHGDYAALQAAEEDERQE